MFIRCPKPLEAAACAPEPPTASGTESEDDGDQALERVQEMLPQPVEILQAEKSGWATDRGQFRVGAIATVANSSDDNRSNKKDKEENSFWEPSFCCSLIRVPCSNRASNILAAI